MNFLRAIFNLVQLDAISREWIYWKRNEESINFICTINCFQHTYIYLIKSTKGFVLALYYFIIDEYIISRFPSFDCRKREKKSGKVSPPRGKSWNSQENLDSKSSELNKYRMTEEKSPSAGSSGLLRWAKGQKTLANISTSQRWTKRNGKYFTWEISEREMGSNLFLLLWVENSPKQIDSILLNQTFKSWSLHFFCLHKNCCNLFDFYP